MLAGVAGESIRLKVAGSWKTAAIFQTPRSSAGNRGGSYKLAQFPPRLAFWRAGVSKTHSNGSDATGHKS